MEYNYDDCVRFVKNVLGLSLFPYQKQILKAFCEGKEVRTARCIGRTYVAQAFGQYVGSLYDKNDYKKQPDAVFPYTCAIEHGLISKEMIDHIQKKLPHDVFDREYLCEYRWKVGTI